MVVFGGKMKLYGTEGNKISQVLDTQTFLVNSMSRISQLEAKLTLSVPSWCCYSGACPGHMTTTAPPSGCEGLAPAGGCRSSNWRRAEMSL